MIPRVVKTLPWRYDISHAEVWSLLNDLIPVLLENMAARFVMGVLMEFSEHHCVGFALVATRVVTYNS